jgi:hypothetical protein
VADFPTAADIAQDFREFAPAIAPVTVTAIEADAGGVVETAENVACLKRVHYRGNIAIGDGTIPDERCRFWLLNEDIGFTVYGRHKVLDADGVSWKVDSSEARALGALIVCETTRVRS